MVGRKYIYFFCQALDRFLKSIFFVYPALMPFSIKEFVRHEPCYYQILFVLTLDRKKMKERILIGKELEIRFRLQGSMNADIMCDLTRPLGSFLTEFEHDPDGE